MKRSLALAVLLVAGAAVPAGASTRSPDCVNGKDDDGDALVDTADPGCESGADYFEGPMTRRFATNYARFRVSIYLSDGTLRTQRAMRVRCRGRDSSFRCSFRFRREHAYRGAIRVFLVRFGGPDGTGDVEADKLVWFRGSCGSLSYGVPYAIRTRNLRCGTARRYIRNWFARGKPMPAGYRCRLVSTTFGGGKPAYCRKGRRFFSFKYPE